MQKDFSKKDRPKHILTLTREALDLNQAQLAELAESSIFTIQSVETHRLKLSERIAWKLGEATGIQAKWFLSHPTGPLPPFSPEALQAKFEEARTGSFKGFYRAHLTSRDIVYQAAWYLREIADYHGGYAGARHSGFLDGLHKATLKLFKTIPTKDRRKVYNAATEAVKAGKVRSLITADLREMDQEAKGAKKRKRNSRLVSQDMQSKALKSTIKSDSKR
jgi:hypothetical protein